MGIRVVLAEDSVLLREGVTRLIAEMDNLELVAAVGTLPALLQAVEDHDPDVVVTDIRMPPTDTDEGVVAARQLQASHPSVGVLVLSQYVEPSYAVDVFESGTGGRGYLLKDRVSQVRELVRAIGEVAAGGSVVDPKVVDALIEGRTADPRLERLTERELEVLELMAQGRSNRGIADELFVSDRAVEKHIGSILDKLELPQQREANRRVQAVLLYLTGGVATA